MTKGIVLFSGGLDSLLAVKVLQQQDVELIGLFFILPFHSPLVDPHSLPPVIAAKKLGLDIRFHYCDREYLEIIKNPIFGYGKGVNPCIDCKIYFLSMAARMMVDEGADFVATGEVVGQRPMSQMKNTLRQIEKRAGLQGRLIRPLSAKILEPTIPEKEGLIDREKFLDINGRSRKRQMQLAADFGIDEYESPGGGCLFTDKFIARRVRHLFETYDDYSAFDVYLLSIGRHFTLGGNKVIIISRNNEENIELQKFFNRSDYAFSPVFKGPVVLGRGDFTTEDISLVGRFISRYGKPEEGMKNVKVFSMGEEFSLIDVGSPIEDEILEKMRI